MSPLPSTGMSSASTTAAISSQRALPEYICVRVRGCSVSTLRAGVLAAQRDLHRVAHLLVPAAADLARHGQVRRRRRRRGSPAARGRGRARQPEPPFRSHDLLDRAAEVDVDELRLEHVGDEARRLAHRRRARRRRSARRSGARPAPKRELVQRRLVLAPDPLGRQELRHHHVGAVLRGRAAGRATPTRRPWGPGRAGRRRRAGTGSASAKVTERSEVASNVDRLTIARARG